MILVKILIAVLLTCAGDIFINKLYSRSSELSFPKKISNRSRFRKPILFFALAILLNLTNDFWIMAAIFLLLLMTLTDFEQYMIFDAMTVSLAIIGGIYSYHSGILQDNLLAAFVGGGVFFLFAIIFKEAMGGGDVKLIFALGLWLGRNLFDVVLYGSILGGIAGLIILAKKKDRKGYFAYGPYFSLTAIYFLLA